MLKFSAVSRVCATQIDKWWQRGNRLCGIRRSIDSGLRLCLSLIPQGLLPSFNLVPHTVTTAKSSHTTPSLPVVFPTMEEDSPRTIPGMSRSDSSGASSVDQPIHAPIPIRPGLPSRRSSGTMIVPRDSSEVGPIELKVGPDDVRAMSPRRTSQDIEALGKQAREELQRSESSRKKGGHRRVDLRAPY